MGVSAWRGLNLSFTDGICHKCAARVRADHLRARYDRGASADRRETAWLPGLAAVSLATLVALVLIARPTHELPPLPPVVALMPPAEEPSASLPSRAAEPASTTVGPFHPPHATLRAAHVAGPPSVRPARSTHRSLEGARLRWRSPAMLTLVAVPLRASPYRVPPRDTAQSP